MTWLGIANENITKKERLITDEVTRSQGATIACRNSPEKMRQIACEQINRLFGLDTSYHFDSIEITQKGSETENE